MLWVKSPIASDCTSRDRTNLEFGNPMLSPCVNCLLCTSRRTSSFYYRLSHRLVQSVGYRKWKFWTITRWGPDRSLLHSSSWTVGR
ncbi:hypothetical protein BDV06DRAFT_200276 [Aspergillus oleicola]